ncbi:thioredoxin-dependent thiol peroxidase [Microterricola viridarii]|uniref:thioredoxin-dependent peroxiredoxin n=1 Tax=Microterricola viridarii TaxID=412690 RepID=A0A1H1R4U4_9MICO|nr:thioredoxin-dependent thiol peroxidase [Microterricola viridarii]SDS30742.1 peroxiredoxin Q/BCP [Microterricola viridarii]
MTESVRLEPGQTAPDFTLQDQSGTAVSLSSYRGQKVVLYFYPAAMTPGCTTQSCDFRDNLGTLASAGYAVLGISKDDVAKLAAFAERDALTFPLLSDTDLAVHKAYGAWGEKNSYGRIITGTLRSTFVIDEEGRITHTFYNTKATGHVAMLRKRLGIAA